MAELPAMFVVWRVAEICGHFWPLITIAG
jgi:hypothetical protein